MMLAAGKGTRLKELTASTPKPLVPLSPNRSIIDGVIARIEALGITEIAVNLHHFGEQIQDYLESRYPEIAWCFFYEKELLNTGGAIANARDFLLQSEDVLVINTDILFCFDLKPFYDIHRQSGSAVSMLLKPKEDRTRAVLYDQNNHISGFSDNDGNILYQLSDRVSENDQSSEFTGIQFINREFIREMGEGTFSIIQSYAETIRSGGKISAISIGNHYWQDLGTIDSLNKGRVFFAKLEERLFNGSL